MHLQFQGENADGEFDVCAEREGGCMCVIHISNKMARDQYGNNEHDRSGSSKLVKGDMLQYIKTVRNGMMSLRSLYYVCVVSIVLRKVTTSEER